MDVSPLEDLLVEYREHGDLLALLKEAQAKFGGLTPELLASIANRLDMRAGNLYGIVSFYSFLSRAPVGRHTIRVCQCVPCRLGNADAVRGALERELRIKPGQTTPDGRFTLQLTNCIGACGHPAALMIDERRFSDLTEGNVASVLAEFD